MKKILVVVLMLALAAPAFAISLELPGGEGKVDIYGQVRMLGVYQNVNSDGTTAQVGNNNDFLFQLQGNSRLGVKVAYGNFFTTAEFGANGDGNPNNRSTFRLLFAGYKFENGLTLTAGRQFVISQTYLEYDNVYDTDNGMYGYGTYGSGNARTASIKLSFANLDILLVSQEPYYGDIAGASYPNGDLRGDINLTSPTGTTVIPVSATLAIADKIMPGLEAAYTLKMGATSLKLMGSYTGTTLQATSVLLPETQRAWVHSATAGFALKYVQPAGLKAVLTGFYALNGNITGKTRWGRTANMPAYNLTFNDLSQADQTAGKMGDLFSGVEDIHTWGAALSIGYSVTEAFHLALGGGFQSISSKGKNFNGIGVLNSYAAYIMSTYKLNQYVVIVPTVGYYNNYTTGTENAAGVRTGDTAVGQLIAGVQLRLMF